MAVLGQYVVVSKQTTIGNDVYIGQGDWDTSLCRLPSGNSPLETTRSPEKLADAITRTVGAHAVVVKDVSPTPWSPATPPPQEIHGAAATHRPIA